MKNAIEQAELYEKGELTFEDGKENRSIKSASKKGSFPCPFCGSYISGATEYYSSFTKVTSMRFINLLNSNNGQSYIDGIIDSIHAVFGAENLAMKKALDSWGFLEQFEQRFNKTDQIDDDE